MDYYRSKFTGKIVSGNATRIIEDIYGQDSFATMVIFNDALVQIDPPSVIDCIDQGDIVLAVYRYRELNPDLSWDESYEKVIGMKRTMNRFRKKKTENI